MKSFLSLVCLALFFASFAKDSVTVSVKVREGTIGKTVNNFDRDAVLRGINVNLNGTVTVNIVPAPEYQAFIKKQDTAHVLPPFFSPTLYTMKDFGKDSVDVLKFVALMRKHAGYRNVLDTLNYGKTIK